MKLFQIEEPDGAPIDPDVPGIAIGLDIGGAEAAVAVAVGGNAVVLEDRDGFVVDLTVPPPEAPDDAWRRLFERARLRAERALAQPVTHAVIVIAAASPQRSDFAVRLLAGCEAAGLATLRILTRDEIGGGAAVPALAAATLAEDMAPPRPPALP